MYLLFFKNLISEKASTLKEETSLFNHAISGPLDWNLLK